MSEDRIWTRNPKEPTEFLERSQAEKRQLGDEFKANFNRLYSQGTYVVLVAGKNHCFNELFLFEHIADARDFYDRGFQQWESFIGDAEEGCGFEQIALYQGGHLTDSKSSAPSKRSNAGDE
jgi:hypothetical protein